MSDETKLNAELSDEQSLIESALRDLELQESAVDHGTVMYRAGWAAAMAECAEPELRRASGATNFWPALAMTFAATTATCLMVILLPHAQNDVAVAAVDPVQKKSVVETVSQDSAGLAQSRKDAEIEVKSPVSVVTRSEGFGLARLIRLPVDRMVAQRDAQIEKYVVEAASPSRVPIVRMDAEWESETSVPLTPRSKFVF
jgi:hypothetical protein